MEVELTVEQKEKLTEFREKILDVLDPKVDYENYLVKWLISRKFDIETAEVMFRKHMRFMKLNGLDKFLENFVPKPVTDYFHTSMLGYDKQGSVVRIVHLGGTDIKGLTLSLSLMDSIRQAAYVLLNDVEKQKKDRANDVMCTKQVYIFDLCRLNWISIIHRTVAARAFRLLKVYEENYPESLKVVYIVNAPSFFSFIYNWLKTFLPESILEKVKLVSPDEYRTVIAEQVDPSILPAALGGTMTDATGDPNCPSLYKKPLYVPVPEDMMLRNQFEALEKDPMALKTIVDKGAVFPVEVVVSEPNAILQWDFQTAYYDISIGLNFKENQKAPWRQIIPFHRVDSHMFPDSGVFECEFPGIYELIFDNTYSWFTRKELTYKVAVLPPNKETFTINALYV